jgi:hypothetical protein
VLIREKSFACAENRTSVPRPSHYTGRTARTPVIGEIVTGKKCTKCETNALEAAFTFSFRTVVTEPEEDVRAQRMEFTIVFCRTSIFRTFCLVGYYTMSNVPYTVSYNDLPN